MMRFRHVVGLAGLLSVVCSCYEWVPDYLSPECANYHMGVHRFVLSSSTIDTVDAHSVRGRVVEELTRQPVGEAVVTLRGRSDSLRTLTTDSSGTFRFENISAGRYHLHIRRVGYEVTADSLNVPLPRDRAIEAAMFRQMLDGPCSGFGKVRVRKPWWKLW